MHHSVVYVAQPPRTTAYEKTANDDEQDINLKIVQEDLQHRHECRRYCYADDVNERLSVVVVRVILIDKLFVEWNALFVVHSQLKKQKVLKSCRENRIRNDLKNIKLPRKYGGEHEYQRHDEHSHIKEIFGFE